VGITFPVGEGVMLSMDGDPLLTTLSRRQPQHRAKKHIRDRVHGQRSMRQGPVQVDGRREYGELGQRNGDEGGDPDVS